MDFNKLIIRYRQFGGLRLVWQYAKLGALWPAVKVGVRCLVKSQSFKAIYPELLRKVEPFFVQKYGSKVQEFKSLRSYKTRIGELENAVVKHKHPKVIWWCWLQGIEAAPPIVKACYKSLAYGEWFKVNGYKINVIDAKNWNEYIELPDYIDKKWEKKIIPPALFSDLLRLELLIKYGGTWIDSTVLCTGFSTQKPQIVQKYLDAPLFLFQYTPEGTSKDISISNWFISAHSNNEVLMVLRDMLFAYWKDYDCTLDYYIFHLFFSMLSKEYIEEMVAMPYGCSKDCLVLLHHLGDKFNQKKWEKMTEKGCFHKLAFRVSDQVKNDQDNYFNKIIVMYA